MTLPENPVRIKTWDTRDQYRPEKGFMPRFGRVLEAWWGPYGEPRIQLTFETGHRRFWHRPRVYDLNRDYTQWVKGVSGLGFFIALAWRV